MIIESTRISKQFLNIIEIRQALFSDSWKKKKVSDRTYVSTQRINSD